MRLNYAKFVNRAPFDNYEIKFDKSNFVAFVGRNGSGKSTFGSYITDSFIELAKMGFYNEFDGKNNIYYRLGSHLNVLERDKPSIVYLRYMIEDGKYADYVDVWRGITKEQYDNEINLPDKIPYERIDSLTKNQSYGKAWSINDNNLIQSVFDNSIITSFPSYRYENPAFLNDIYKIKPKFIHENRFSGFMKNQIVVTSSLEEVACWIMDVVLDNEIYKKEGNIISALNFIINNILYPKVNCETMLGIGQRLDAGARIAITKRRSGGKVIYPSIYNMSSGELMMFVMFAEIVRQADNCNKTIDDIEGIVVIDEIDKHLHFDAENSTLPLLISIFPKIQFITTSHSPFLGYALASKYYYDYKIYDLDNEGKECIEDDYIQAQELQLSLNKEAAENKGRYKELLKSINDADKLCIITEGKTDWMHIKKAASVLNYDINKFNLIKIEDPIGDSTLIDWAQNQLTTLCKNKIIAMVDRDNSKTLNKLKLDNKPYMKISDDIYCFAIPCVNEGIYGTNTCIEKYYKEKDLKKEDKKGRRLFTGSEFYKSLNSKDGKYQLGCENRNKIDANKIIDTNVYLKEDFEHSNNIALSKYKFVELVLNDNEFSKDFEFAEFQEIFNILDDIYNDINK